MNGEANSEGIAFMDERGGLGIRIKPAAAIVREYGDQFRLMSPLTPARQPARRRLKQPTLL
jgi:hypothetical protein